jgi:hypothetical protein
MDGISHYYGDIVRRLFLAAGVMILLALPFAATRVPWPATILLLVALASTVVAGLTNPKQIWVMWLNVLTALIGILAFEGHAIIRAGNDSVWVFVFDQALALLFFFALYYSIKTLRGWAVPDERSQQSPVVFEEPPSPEDEHPRGSGGLMP